MAIIKKTCPYCHKTTDLKSELKLPTSILMTFKCGHSIVESRIDIMKDYSKEIEDYRSIDNKSLFKYQQDGVKLILSSNGRCLIGDEMGLGKTAQSLVPIALKKDQFLPALVVCKSVAKINWLKETLRFGKSIAQVISSGKEPFHMEFPIHIISYDLLTRIMKGQKKKFRADLHQIRERCKLVILDETHLIKNPTADRAVEVKRLCGGEQTIVYGVEHDYPAIKHVIGLSGTPIKNNASEFFTILNILHPEKYWRQSQFCEANVELVWDGYGYKYGGLRNPERFMEEIKDFFIRRTMDDVLPDIPKLWRHPNFTDLEGEVAEIYEKEEEEFAEYYEENYGAKDFTQNILARMARLRHLTSLAKIEMTINSVTEFLFSTNRKLAIFCHHLDTRDILAERLNQHMKEAGLPPVLVLAAKDKSQIELEIQKFREGQGRVIVLSTLAHGESLNLQFCADSILHERQWNPANEDQAISGRFRRIGQEAERINCTIQIAIGTIDEYFAELVERKRQYFDETVSGERRETQWNETSLVMELADLIAKKGKRFKL